MNGPVTIPLASAIREEKTDLLPDGSLVGNYVIEALIGVGGCGRVYRARHGVSGQRVAIKVLSRALANSRQMLARFEREARAASLIHHPNIVDVHEFGNAPDGRPFYAMELLEGPSLDAIIKRQGRFAPAETLEVLEPVCAALQAAHEAGIIHRDLTGGNVIVVDRGNQKLPKLLDFGIAKLIHPEPGETGLTSAGMPMGTPIAMAPEQFRGEAVDARTDVYALGMLVYRMLTGQLPWDGKDYEAFKHFHLAVAPPPPSRMAPTSAELNSVVLRCLEKQPEHRYPSVAAFLEALRSAVQGPQGAEARQVRSTASVAIYAEARIDPNLTEEGESALLEDLGLTLRMVVENLQQARLQIALQTGNAVLGVLPLSDRPAESAQARQYAMRVALHLCDQLAKRRNPDPHIHFNVCLHVAPVLIQVEEIVGGEMLRIGEWAPKDRVNGLYLTPQAGVVLSEPRGA